jgi:hypothetical protein
MGQSKKSLEVAKNCHMGLRVGVRPSWSASGPGDFASKWKKPTQKGWLLIEEYYPSDSSTSFKKFRIVLNA